jgi:predicted RNA methylase
MPFMAKLSKEEIKLHEQALRLLDKEELTFDEKCFVLDNWHEGANHINSKAGAFFTPESVAGGVAIEASGRSFIDLCAGIGRLAFAVWDYKNPFHSERVKLDFTCIETNPDYIEVGKKIMPQARWIRADVLDLPADIGHFDCAIANPPFGNIAGSKKSSPRIKNGPFEYKVIDVASDIADHGVFIIPQGSSPFKISGCRTFELQSPAIYERFVESTGIVLDHNCGIDTTVDAKWRGVKIITEIVLADFKEVRIRRNPVIELEAPSQGELFAMAA